MMWRWRNLPRFKVDYFFVFFLLMITGGLYWKSYIPGTWLMGWDSVMSEIDFPLAFDRAINGVWQSFQGLGVQGGHGYVSDLVRLPWLWLISLIFPVSLVRYVMVYIMWAGGMVGAFGLFRFISKRPGIALIGSLLYGLHPYTISNFFVIHDAFGWLFLWLPWSLWLLFSLSKTSLKRGYLKWLLLQFAASFIGFIPPAFVGYLVTLVVITGGLWLAQRISFKKGLMILGLTVIANSYWLLPFSYYSLRQSGDYVQAKLNQNTTEENVFKSRAYGHVTDLVLGKNYYFESLDWSGTETKPIMNKWIEWWGKPEVRVLLWIFAGIALLGVISTLMSRSGKEGRAWVMATGVIVCLLALETQPFMWINERLRQVPLLNQAFRIPFTKLSFEYSLLFAGLVVYGLRFLLLRCKTTIIRAAVVLMMVLAIGWMSRPLVGDAFFYDKMRVTLPDRYVHLMESLRQFDALARIAVFPVHSYNGWYIDDWNYTGSGFLFYGVKQPLMDRTFDVWSPYNETYYNELSSAFYGCSQAIDCVEPISQLFRKYGISLAVLDESLLVANHNTDQLKIDFSRELFRLMGGLPILDEDGLSLWRFDAGVSTSVIPSWKRFEAETVLGRSNAVLDVQRPWVKGAGKSLDAVYPFAHISNEKMEGVTYLENGMVALTSSIIPAGNYHLNWPLHDLGAHFSGRAALSLSGQLLSVHLLPLGELMMEGKMAPSWIDYTWEIMMPASITTATIFVNGVGQTVHVGEEKELWDVPLTMGKPITMEVTTRGGRLITKEQIAPEVWQTLSRVTPSLSLHSDQVVSWEFPVEWATVGIQSNVEEILNCDVLKRGEISKQLVEGMVQYSANGFGALCDGFALPLQGDGYNALAIRMKGTNLAGKGFRFNVYSQLQQRTVVEGVLPAGRFDETYVLLPGLVDDFYSMTLETRSFGSIAAQNQVEAIMMYSLPISWLQHIVLTPQILGKDEAGLLLTLNQAFGEGWILLSKSFPWTVADAKHVVVDGWANGWIVPDGKSIADVKIIYWPQLLEWLGFGFLAALVARLWFDKNQAS